MKKLQLRILGKGKFTRLSLSQTKKGKRVSSRKEMK